MKHKVKVEVPVEKRGLFGRKKTVMEKQTITVDGPTYRRMKKEERKKPFSDEELMFYDMVFDDDED